jgi:hypothetical protein
MQTPEPNTTSDKKIGKKFDPAIVVAVIAALAAIIAAGISSFSTFSTVPRESIEKRLLEAGNQMKDSALREEGIKAMKRIMQDSPSNQWDIIDNFTKIVRKKSPAPKKLNILLKNRKLVSEEVKTILTVIKTRVPENDHVGWSSVNERRVLNLAEVNFFGADLQKANLPEADLSRSDLTNVSLIGSNFKDAYLRGAYLRGTDLSDADLTGADLEGADLMGVALENTNLTRANLRGAKLTVDNLTDEQIKKACNWQLAIDNTGRLEEMAQEDEQDSSTNSDCKKFDP